MQKPTERERRGAAGRGETDARGGPATHALALDIGGTHVTAALVEVAAGRVVEASRARLPVEAAGEAEAILACWASAASEALGQLPPDGRLAGAGVAMPGPFDYEGGISLIDGVGKYERLFGLNVRAELRERLEFAPPILFRNDASCFLLGEACAGAAARCADAIGITLGTGFGSAFMRGGELVERGEGVPVNGWLYDEPYKDARAEDYFSARGLLRDHREATGEAIENVARLAEAAAAGGAAAATFRRFGERLGDFLAGRARAFRPGVVVIGGNIARAWNLFAPALHDAFARHGGVGVVCPSRLFEDAALLGASQLPLRYREPTAAPGNAEYMKHE